MTIKRENDNEKARIESPITTSLEENALLLNKHMKHTQDLVCEKFTFNSDQCLICYLETVIDNEILNTKILRPLFRKRERERNNIDDIPLTGIKQENSFLCLKEALVNGQVILFQERNNFAYTIPALINEELTPQEPQNEKSIVGTHVGFIERLDTNISLIRKYISNPDLVIKFSTIGKVRQQKTALVFLDRIVDPIVLKEAELLLGQLQKYDINSVQELRPLIINTNFLPFPQILITERVDRVIGNILKGKVAIIINGSSSCALLPVSFFSFFEASEDINNNLFVGTFMYILRLFGCLITILLPSIYISIVAFHSDVLPRSLLYTFKLGIEFVPIHPFLEAIMMQIILEVLREAASRLPGPIATTIGIVGGLVIGNTIVEINLISKPMVIVIALTALASFTIPIHEMSTSMRLLGFFFTIMAGLFGFIGVAVVFMILLVILCDIEVLGKPYFSLENLIRIPTIEVQKKLMSLRKILRIKKTSLYKRNENE
ncbi:spore germination protein (plasmid) [Bacillus thuringiensis LM1212]|uniref:spore germination protein n=1 Tax=Bacillus thuringiensis TaxID=1428 RepID=UPI0003FA6F1A|nr:spore germination protein [Bacillus thuringiensis]AXY11328.1 spore germination protein [Bacillus thuringiensis LM1212]